MVPTLRRGNPVLDRSGGRVHSAERQWRTFPRKSVGTIKAVCLGNMQAERNAYAIAEDRQKNEPRP